MTIAGGARVEQMCRKQMIVAYSEATATTARHHRLHRRQYRDQKALLEQDRLGHLISVESTLRVHNSDNHPALSSNSIDRDDAA